MLKSRRVDLILSKGHLLFQYLMLCVRWSLFWIVVHQPAVEAMAARRKARNLKKWEKKISDIKITKEDMNKLVMNFLLIEGYVDAAEKFYMETGTEHIDLTTVTDRMAVKSAVESGNVEEAIEKLKVLDPKVLDTNRQLFFRLQQQRMIELIKNGKNKEALDFGKELLAPISESSNFDEDAHILSGTTLATSHIPCDTPVHMILKTCSLVYSKGRHSDLSR
ncbi:GID8-like protein [Drosera capensis]